MLSVESSRGGAKFLEGDRGVFGLTQLLIESIIKASVTASLYLLLTHKTPHHNLKPLVHLPPFALDTVMATLRKIHEIGIGNKPRGGVCLRRGRR